MQLARVTAFALRFEHVAAAVHFRTVHEVRRHARHMPTVHEFAQLPDLGLRLAEVGATRAAGGEIDRRVRRARRQRALAAAHTFAEPHAQRSQLAAEVILAAVLLALRRQLDAVIRDLERRPFIEIGDRCDPQRVVDAVGPDRGRIERAGGPGVELRAPAFGTRRRENEQYGAIARENSL